MEEALALLDHWAELAVKREQFSSGEILDLTLDLRQALTRVAEPVG